MDLFAQHALERLCTTIERGRERQHILYIEKKDNGNDMPIEPIDPAFDSSNVNDPNIASLRNQLIVWTKQIAVGMIKLREQGLKSDLIYNFLREALGTVSNESQASAEEIAAACLKADCMMQLLDFLANAGEDADLAAVEKQFAEACDSLVVDDETLAQCVRQGDGRTTPEALRAELGDAAYGLHATILAGLRYAAVTANRAILMAGPARQKLVYEKQGLEDRICSLNPRKKADAAERRALEPEVAALETKIAEWQEKERLAIDCMADALAVLENAGTDLAQLAEAVKATGQASELAFELSEYGSFNTFGDPVPAVVRLNPQQGECVAFCGDDFLVLKDLLEVAEFYGINVWTFGSAIGAHMYPELKKSPRLAGHLPGPRYMQNKVLGAFPGATLVSSPVFDKPGDDFEDYVFAAYPTQWEGVKRLERKADGKLDFTPLIRGAKDSGGYSRTERVAVKLPVGFGGEQMPDVVNKLADAYRDGRLKRVFIVGGEDEPDQGNDYYAKFYEALPEETAVVVFGDVKSRFHQAQGANSVAKFGIPRVLDMGRVSDLNTIVRFAKELDKELGRTPENSPVAFRIGVWGERSVAAFLAICSLGYKDVAVGPYRPAAWNDEIVETFKTKLNVRLAGAPEADAALS